MAKIGDQYGPGDRVPTSGIYRVDHEPAHAAAHEVTCVFGRAFPECIACKKPKFTLLRPAVHVEANEHFSYRF